MLRARAPALLVTQAIIAWLALVLVNAGARDRSHSAAVQATPAHESRPWIGSPAIERRRRLLELGVARWHETGWRGQGVRIAILDSGFRGYRAHLGGALPANVRVRSFRADGDLEARNSQHGVLCAEVVHTLAPDAELLLANWEADSRQSFLDAVRWARREGASLISCSVIMPSWSDGEGGGAFDAELSALVGSGDRAGDLLFFASAGNTAQRHWAGTFRAAADGAHEWPSGETFNALTPWGDEEVTVELYAHSATRYEVEVREPGSGRPAGRPRSGLEGLHSWSSVRFRPRPDATYEVRVWLREGRPGPFHLVALGAGLGDSAPAGSVACPADCRDVVALGACDTRGEREPYSSCGVDAGCLKPDLVACVPFPSLVRQRPFSGTSAAAPQAAGLAALYWGRYPACTARQVRDALLRAAHDTGPPGPDAETGHGVVSLPLPRLPSQPADVSVHAAAGH